MFLLGCCLQLDTLLRGWPWSGTVSDMNRITHCNNKQTQWSNTNISTRVALFAFVLNCSDTLHILKGQYSTQTVSLTKGLFYFFLAEISEYEDGRRRSLSVQEGSTVLIECPLPHSVPPALPRLRVRGERIEVSTGMFEYKYKSFLNNSFHYIWWYML